MRFYDKEVFAYQILEEKILCFNNIGDICLSFIVLIDKGSNLLAYPPPISDMYRF